jgi:endo-1,4-beta-xylanase
MKQKLSRRDFLKLASVTSAGLALSACGVNATGFPTPTMTSTVLPSPTTTTTLTATPQPLTLRRLADKLGINFGTVGSSWSIDQPKYTETLLNIANTLMIAGPSEVTEKRLFANVNWHDVLQRWDEASATLSQGEIPDWIPADFSRTDIIMDFAERNGLRVFFGHLFWPSTESLPIGIFDNSFTNDDLRKILEFMVKAKATRYRGKVEVWSINEIVSHMLYGTPQEKSLFQRLGTNFVEDVFRWAREVDPQAKLMFNESHIEQPDNQLFTKISGTTIELLRTYKQEGIPVDLVGSHFHTWIYDPPNFQVVSQIIETIKGMGYDFWASEVTVSLADQDIMVTDRKKRVEVSGDLLQAQAQLYQELLETILKYNGGFILFEFNDSADDMFAQAGFPEARAHIFDENFEPKPAYYALFDVLQKHAQGG